MLISDPGSGKELVARKIHKILQGERAFFIINAALPKKHMKRNCLAKNLRMEIYHLVH